MKHTKIILFLFTSFVFTSCITTREVQYLQPSESLTIDGEGLVSYNVQEYRVTKNDILDLNIITTPDGDAAQFYSRLNTDGTAMSEITSRMRGSGNGSNRFYFNGIKVNSKGEIYVFGIGYIKAEGRTVEEISQEIQTEVNKNFLEGKSEVRLNLDGIHYFILGDLESTGMTGEKTAYTQRLNILEAIALNGGLNRSVDRKNVTLQRKYPEGIKMVKLDLTREDLVNSPYFWLQNGDMILLNTRQKNFYGFGREPIQTLTTGVSLMTTALTIYLLINRL
ncbi:MAG: polysaccharide biosynthesis/export family protein [Flavobacteriaceae bacterium]|nr:polysaccharide biosynthesis/export family protein [Flavobacteriaceae bacterium]